jgi:hypothetical protein
LIKRKIKLTERERERKRERKKEKKKEAIRKMKVLGLTTK